MSATDEQVARVCHEANRAWCAANGDDTQLPWNSAEQWQRDSALAGVSGARAGNTPEQSHEAWSAYRRADGWVHGPSKDPEVKTHPCLVPYADLPPEQRAKDALFVAIVGAL